MSAELRRAAIARAEAMRSPRGAEVLRRSQLELRESAEWESSDGTVHGADVRVLVDGFSLGAVSSSPSVRDAVIEAISAVAPRVIDASVADVHFDWALREQSEDRPYRDPPAERVDPRSADDVRRALAGFLAASGDDAAARAVDRCTLRIGRTGAIAVDLDPNLIRAPLSTLFGEAKRILRVR